MLDSQRVTEGIVEGSLCNGDKGIWSWEAHDLMS